MGPRRVSVSGLVGHAAAAGVGSMTVSCTEGRGRGGGERSRPARATGTLAPPGTLSLRRRHRLPPAVPRPSRSPAERWAEPEAVVSDTKSSVKP